ncbi:hypothetical protein RSAG8_03716, partial [Rhizoctonia solani AG-8 WAC10335]
MGNPDAGFDASSLRRPVAHGLIFPIRPLNKAWQLGSLDIISEITLPYDYDLTDFFATVACICDVIKSRCLFGKV